LVLRTLAAETPIVVLEHALDLRSYRDDSIAAILVFM
jgi:hypothetical protein